ncbi:MAG: thioredoxin family protein [Nitrospirota bacterium]
MRRTTMIVPMIAAMLLFTGYESGAGSIPAPLSTPELKQALGAGKKTIVFFLNPQGGPCKAQNEVLTKLHQDRKGNFLVAYVDAMNPAHQKAFYDYGVRSLPTLVLVDSKGKISRAFPPGIQTYEAMAKALDGAP